VPSARRTGRATKTINTVAHRLFRCSRHRDGFAAIHMKQGDIARKEAATERTADALWRRLAQRVQFFQF